jgi:hypothetical protein
LMMLRPCSCNRIRLGSAYSTDQCRKCWCWRHSQTHINRWWEPTDGPKPTPEPVPPGSAFRPPEPRPASGPGTELKALLATLGITPSGCACESRARRMDAGGVEWCREHRDEIAGWLRDEAAKRGWGDVFAAGARAVLSGLAFRIDPADVYGSLVSLAIERAEAK